MKIVLMIVLAGELFQKDVDWPFVPRVNDQVELTDGGWSEPVTLVWWQAHGDGRAIVDVGKTSGQGVQDPQDEDLADSLIESGWRKGTS